MFLLCPPHIFPFNSGQKLKWIAWWQKYLVAYHPFKDIFWHSLFHLHPQEEMSHQIMVVFTQSYHFPFYQMLWILLFSYFYCEEISESYHAAFSSYSTKYGSMVSWLIIWENFGISEARMRSSEIVWVFESTSLQINLATLHSFLRNWASLLTGTPHEPDIFFPLSSLR